MSGDFGRVRLRSRRPRNPRSFHVGRGRYFAAAGWGRYGPYAVSTVRIRRTVLKGTAGTRGVTIGARQKLHRNLAVEGNYNLVTHKPGVGVRYKKRRIML